MAIFRISRDGKDQTRYSDQLDPCAALIDRMSHQMPVIVDPELRRSHWGLPRTQSGRSRLRRSSGQDKPVHLDPLAEIPIPLPPLEEQQEIVEILEAHLSRLDAALQHIQTLRYKAAQFRRSLLHAAFTGALTGHDFQVN